MKKFNYAIGSGMILIIAFVFMSFSNSSVNNGNGNVVQIDTQTWGWFADNCIAPVVIIEDVRVQTASNGFINVTGSLVLPEGHCDIPEKGANVVQYPNGSRAVINSKGKVNFKWIVTPN